MPRNTHAYNERAVLQPQMKVLLLQVSLVLLLAGTAWPECLQRSYRGTKSCLAKRIFAPVCGTDGCTYSNEDVLRCAEAEDRENLPEEQVVRVASQGSCEDNVEEKEGEQRAKEAEEMKGEEETAEGKEGENEGVELAENRLFP